MLAQKYTLICDDVRTENTGKLFVIGVCNGVIGTAQLPCHLPMGLTFLHCWESDRPGPVDMKLRIQHLESGQTLLEARANLNIATTGTTMAPLRLGPLQFNSAGADTLVIDIEGQRGNRSLSTSRSSSISSSRSKS